MYTGRKRIGRVWCRLYGAKTQWKGLIYTGFFTRNYTLNQGLRLYEKDASDTKLLCTTRLFKKLPRLTWKNIYPHLFPQLIHTIDDDHSNDRYQKIRLKLTGNHFSHRQLHRGIIYQKLYSEQNQLVKLNTLQKWHKSPTFLLQR